MASRTGLLGRRTSRMSDVLPKVVTSCDIRTSSTLPRGKSLTVQRMGEFCTLGVADGRSDRWKSARPSASLFAGRLPEKNNRPLGRLHGGRPPPSPGRPLGRPLRRRPPASSPRPAAPLLHPVDLLRQRYSQRSNFR